MGRRRAYAQIATHRGQIRLAVASQMPRGICHAHVPNVLAQPGKRFAVIVVQDAYEVVNG